MYEHLSLRSALITTAHPGSEAAAELARVTDEAVRELARAASSTLRDRWAVIALGGWGCGALLPASDLDILLLSDAPEARLRPFAEAILYPLWDSGLKVGHQVRTPKGQLSAMRTDLATRTAGLTGRAIAGDLEWADMHLASWASDARRRAKQGLKQLAERPRPGSPWQLQTDLKHDAGGRRDYDEMTWTAATLTGRPSRDPSGLVELGLLTADEMQDLASAAEIVSRARWVLQRDGLGDVMTIEAANTLGEDAEKVQDALGRTALALHLVRQRLREDRRAEDAPWTPDRLMSELASGAAGLSRLELAAQSGALEGLLPGFRRLMSVRRPGIGHELTVGDHCLTTASLIGDTGDDAALARSRSGAGDLTPVRIAALVHDVAKASNASDHASEGAPLAVSTALSLGMTEDDSRLVGELVRLHLALIETALHRDLNDENVVLECASRVGDRRLVAPLHLLTAADSMATNRATWTSWTASLMTSLVVRLDAALSPDVDGAGLAQKGTRVRDALLDGLGATRAAERAFIAAAPLRYLAARDGDDVLRDASLVAELLSSPGQGTHRTAVTAGPIPETARVTVAAVERPFLLSSIAGAASLAGLDILSLDAYGTVGDVVLDSFVVQSSSGRGLLPAVFAQFDRFAAAALTDRYDLSTRLGERRRHYPPRTSGAVKVNIYDGAWDTIVRVRVPSRPGLLHDLASAVSSTGLDIRWARANTVNGMADDTFHVTGEDGAPVTDPGILGHLSMRLREAASPKL